jgi:AraC-like DNA-binding protein
MSNRPAAQDWMKGMRTVLSTDDIRSGDKFGQWCELIRENYCPVEGSRNGDMPFEARLEIFDVCTMPASRLTQSPAQYEICGTPARKNGFDDAFLAVGFRTRGITQTLQNGRSSIQRAGDIVIRELRPLTLSISENIEEYNIIVPRHRIEKFLGNAKIFTSLTLEATETSTTLANSFFAELIRIRDQLCPDTAARMGSIGIDLIVASMAERLAREVPRPLHGTLVVQRAKAYIESHIDDPTLDPDQLAAAMGVSLRRLQELFKQQGHHISEWIWERRLDTAAEHLADHRSGHVQIAELAYGCGFSSQPHFSRRFKDRFGVTPRNYREHVKS